MYIVLQINGKPAELAAETSLSQLLQKWGTSQAVAISLNGGIILPSDWQKTQLKNGDKLEILTAVAGG